MKSLLNIVAFLMLTLFSFRATAQHDNATKEYKHKVVVDSIIQTKAYTYLKVKEVFSGKDSIIWLALPSFEPTIGATYYHDGGLEMGTFHSKELNRDFNPIVFSSFVSTSSEVSDKNILPKPAIDTIPVDQTPAALHTVLIKEVLEAGGYTYLRADENNKEVWLAIVKANIVAGNIYTYEDAAPMKNFKSRELNRTFDEVLFVAKLTLKGNNGGITTDKKKLAEEKKANTLSAKGNVSLSDLYKYKESFAGKTIRITGTVTKFNANILGKNWIHVEDGSLKKNPSDIIVTIDEEVKIGDKVICEGQITTDRDFGSGYKFDVMMENAKIIR
jgi:GW (Gly-Tryp) dipeptide domain